MSVVEGNIIKKHFNLKEFLLPACCYRSKSSSKSDVYRFSKIIRRKISTDGILDLFKEFENLKYLILDDMQFILFDYMKNFSYKKLLSNLKPKIAMNKAEIMNILKILETSDSPMNRRLISKILV